MGAAANGAPTLMRPCGEQERLARHHPYYPFTHTTCSEGGAGYVAAKHGEHVLAETLRLEIVGRPVRVVEIAPGMVKTDEFALTRFAGDQDKAAKVYQGVADPLTADDVADTITWAVTRPAHVNIDLLVVRPRAQASNTKVHREG